MHPLCFCSVFCSVFCVSEVHNIDHCKPFLSFCSVVRKRERACTLRAGSLYASADSSGQGLRKHFENSSIKLTKRPNSSIHPSKTPRSGLQNDQILRYITSTIANPFFLSFCSVVRQRERAEQIPPLDSARYAPIKLSDQIK